MVPQVLLEDNHCLAVSKPAGLLTQGDITGEPSLLDWVREDLRVRFQKPGNVFVGLVHRLDRPVSGVVLFGKTSKGAARLSKQFREGTVEKLYWAIVEGEVDGEAGEWADWLGKDEANNVVRVVAKGSEGGRPARLGYRVLGRDRGRTTLELRPITGRSHQLRVQLASRGLPITGDRKYGASSSVRAEDGGFRIGLHARSVRFAAPTRSAVIEAIAPVPPDWPGSRV
ncbi:RNA pseudouridine synthase [soil metagenome]